MQFLLWQCDFSIDNAILCLAKRFKICEKAISAFFYAISTFCDAISVLAMQF
jgi:hypothetical protein